MSGRSRGGEGQAEERERVCIERRKCRPWLPGELPETARPWGPSLRRTAFSN